MSNTILTPDIIAREAMLHLENELVLANMINADYSNEFTGEVGDTINVRRPIRLLGQENNLDIASFNNNIEDANVPVVMDKTLTVPFRLSATERTLDITNDRVQNIIRSAAITARDYVEAQIAETMYRSVYFFGGTPGTRPASFLTLATEHAHMTDAAVPMDGRCAVHAPLTGATLADSFKSHQMDRRKVTTAMERASFGTYAGFDNYTSVHVPRHQVGAYGGTPLVDGAGQNVTYEESKTTYTQSLVTNGWTNSVTNVLRAGDVITLAGVQEVNPISKQSTGRLQTFVVTANANSGASTGPATLTISPPIITTGPYQTVTAAPANDAVITVVSGTANTAYDQSLLFHKDAMLIVSRRLVIPGDAGVKTSSISGNRMSISVSEATTFSNLSHGYRLDILFGLKVTAPYLARRLTG